MDKLKMHTEEKQTCFRLHSLPPELLCGRLGPYTDFLCYKYFFTLTPDSLHTLFCSFLPLVNTGIQNRVLQGPHDQQQR